MDKDQYLEFLKKYALNQHTREEHRLFLQWFHRLPEREAARVVGEYLRFAGEDPPAGEEQIRALLVQKIETKLDESDLRDVRRMQRWYVWKKRLLKYTAILLLLGGAGIYLFFFPEPPSQAVTRTQQVRADVEPGGNKAVLTLSDGKNIVLDQASDGAIAEQGGTSISKLADGQLVYQAGSLPAGSPELADRQLFNTITTPKGGQYRVALPDGTKVWLNAHSSIRFPAIFGEGPRDVEITGEVYFEVSRSPDGTVPFRVISRGQVVEVLGTRFNVQAYEDDPVTRTTLAEGSVKIWAEREKGTRDAPPVRLRPGEQSLFLPASGTSAPSLRVERVDVEAALAWQKGYFKFNSTPLADIMQQLERWYDVEVVYRNKVPAEQFTGFVSRNVRISNVLKMLEHGGGVTFRIAGRKIVVNSTAE